MRNRLAVVSLAAMSLVVGLLHLRQMYLRPHGDHPLSYSKELRVLTYSSFVGASGPGSEIVSLFEKEHGVRVNVVTAGDAGLLLERMKIAQASVPFDVVIGLDQLMLPEATKRFRWRETFFATSGRQAVLAEFASPCFVAYDWSPLTFIYRRDARHPGEIPARINDLTERKFKTQFALQDPHSSSPGFQFFAWVKALKGSETEAFLRAFRPNVNSVSPSWAFSYGLFNKNQTRFVWSYLTSLAYHWGANGARDYQVVVFREGHPVQVEYVGIPQDCRECELAQAFVEEMLHPRAQTLIMEKNFMFPVIKGLERGTVFSELPQLKTVMTEAGRDFSEWDRVFQH
ncbi:MAG: thiamine ABC transporter substrate-binding protein [Bdellovibrionales bacterium]